jgi:soluble lytic murein transglycosylase-like protein
MTSVVRSDPRTGKLVRSLVVAGKPAASRKAAENETAPRTAPSSGGTPAGFEQAVDRIASLQGLPPELLHSVIQVESNSNPYAVSPKGALGIMQLIPDTARRFGVADVFDPVQNVEGGARYLRYLLGLFDGNYPLALAAYNAGENAVARYGTIPPYPETQNYLKLVAKHLEKAQGISAAKVRERKGAEAKLAEPKADGNHVQEVIAPDGTVRYVSQ